MIRDIFILPHSLPLHYFENLCNYQPSAFTYIFEQLVEFQTWSRLVNGVLRTSVLDHIYFNDATMLSNMKVTSL